MASVTETVIDVHHFVELALERAVTPVGLFDLVPSGLGQAFQISQAIALNGRPLFDIRRKVPRRINTLLEPVNERFNSDLEC